MGRWWSLQEGKGMVNVTSIHTQFVDILPDGTITLPPEVLEALCLAPGDTLCFRVSEGRVFLEKQWSLVEHLFGSVKALNPPVDVEKTLRIAREEKVLRMIENGEIGPPCPK